MRTTNGPSDYIELDGLRLDGYGWNYKRAVAPSLPSVRSAASVLPGRPGRVYVPGIEVHEPAEVPVTLQVFPANPMTGIVSSNFNSRRAQLEDNLQTLLGVIGQPGKSFTYRYVDADGTAWTARAVLIIPARVSIRPNNYIADLTFTLEIPDVYLRSANVSNSYIPQPTSDGLLYGFNGGTAPIYDAVITFTQGWTNPQITVGDQWLKVRGSVSSGTIIDTGKMTARSSASGPSIMADVGWSGSSMLVFTPTVTASGGHEYRVNTTAPINVAARKARFA